MGLTLRSTFFIKIIFFLLKKITQTLPEIAQKKEEKKFVYLSHLKIDIKWININLTYTNYF